MGWTFSLLSPHVSNHSTRQLGQPITGHRADALREGEGAVVGCSFLWIPKSTRETCPIRRVQWQLEVRGQVGELAVAVHDLPDRSVAAGGAGGWTGQSCWLLCWI